jgi:fatty-acyl-CoA synthase
VSTPTVDRWVSYWGEVRPDGPAVVFDEQTTSWAELDASVDGMVAGLDGLGVGQGDRVACLASNRPEFYSAFFACSRLGAIFVSLNTRWTSPEIDHVLADSGTTVLITEDKFVDLVASLEAGDRLGVLNLDDEVDRSKSAVTRSPAAFSDIVAILYTSGTTGVPKGAAITHGNVFFAVQNILRAFDFTSDDRHLVVLPLCFTGGLITLSQPAICSGGTIYLEETFDPAQTLKRIPDEQLTVFFAAPAVLQLLRLYEDFDVRCLDSLKIIVAGAAPVPEPLLDFYDAAGVPIAQGYGCTEGGGFNVCLLPADAKRKIGSAGRACMHTEVKVVDDAGNAAAVNALGEVLLRGPSVMREYWQNPVATAEAFDDGWLRTGDLGRIDEEGFLTIVDRIKDMIITGGMNVYPAEVEAHLYGHPLIVEVAVVAMPHDVFGETVVAVAVVQQDEALTLEEIRTFCSGHLADYKIPRRFERVDSLPRNVSGKVLKFEIQDSLA